MTTQNIETLLPKIVPLLPGCNDEIAIIALSDGARTFARESDIIIETKSYSDSEAPEYGRIPEFAEDPDNFLPHHFISQEKDPNNKRIYVTYSLLPIARLFPAAVLSRHYEAIVEYALFLLCNMPGKPWTNTDLATFHYQKYRTALGDAIRDNSTNGAVFDQSIVLADDYEYQGGLTVTVAGNGTDTSDATATADQLVYPATAYVKGEKITGKIRNVTASISDNVVTVPQGNIANKQTLTVAEMAEPTVTANVVTIGKGYNKTQKSVTIPEAGELSVSGNVVTVPVGYIKSQRSATVAEAAAPTTSGNVVTVNKGYQSAEKKITVGTAKAAATITPGTSDQTVSSGTYLTGNLTVKGDSKLIAANIKEGETIFGIVGTHKGGNDIDLSGVTVTADKMLSGIVAVGADGNKVTGNIQTVAPSVNKNTFTVGKGYVAEAFSQTIAESGASVIEANKVTVPAGFLSADRVETIAEATVTETDSSVTITPGYVGEELNYDIGGNDIDLSFVTVKPENMLKGTVAIDANGDRIVGNISKVAAMVEGNYVIVPEGYHSYQQQFQITNSGEGGDVDGHRLVRVVYYQSPIVESFSAVCKIIVSGIGFVGYEDEEYPEDSYGADYSNLNGTYLVVPSTEHERDYRNRIYYNTNPGVISYISYFYDGEDEAGWQISYNSPRDSGVLKIYNVYLFNSQTDETITRTWYSPEYEAETEVTLDCQTAEYEQRGESVGVCDALVENAPTELWNFENHDLYDTVPVLGGVYAAYQKKLIGRPVYMDAADGGKGIVLLTHFSKLCQKIDDWTYITEIVDEVGLCMSLAQLSNTDIIRSNNETPYIGSKFGTQFMRFDDLDLPDPGWNGAGGLMIYTLPTLNAFTIEYWQFNNFEQNGTPEVGGVVLFDAESSEIPENTENYDGYIVTASNDRTKTLYKRWFHHAFTHGENSDIVKEYINGELVAEHEFRGTYRWKRYNEDQQKDEYEYTGTIGGDLFFCPGGKDGHGSNKAVCQLIIWNRDIGSNGVVQQSNCTRAIHYR